MDQQSQSAQKMVPLPGMVPSTAANEPQQRQRLASFAGKATILKKTLSRTNTAVDLDMLQETRDSALLAPPASQSVQRAKRRLQLYVETQASLKTGLEDLRMMAGLSADALEESAQAVQEPACVVLPSSRLSKATDIIQVLLLLYVSFMVPLRFGFSLDLRVGEAMWWWELVVDAYFCFDIVLNFYTAYPDPGDPRHLVTDRRTIARRYLRSWFLIDTLSVMPIGYIREIMVEDSSGGNQTKILKLFRLTRLAKLLRLARLKRLMQKYADEFESFAAMFKLGSTMASLVGCGHMIACLWYYIGDTDGGWVRVHFPPAEDVPNIDPNGVSQLNDLSPTVDKYLQAFWFALGVMLAPSYTPAIMPTTRLEVAFVSVLIIIGTVMFAIVIGTVSSLLVSKKLLESKVERQLAELREFLQEKNIPKDIRLQIKHFMQKLYQTRTGYDATEVIESLPPLLRNKLLDQMYRKLLLRVPMFRHSPPQAIQRLCLVIKPYAVMKDDVVTVENNPAEEMYFVLTGRVQLVRYGLVLGVLSNGSYFGQEGLLPGKRFREHTVTALCDCELLFLNATDVHKIAQKYPELIDNIRTAAEQRAKRDDDKLNDLIKQSAQSLGVDIGSGVMQEVLGAIEVLSAEGDSTKQTGEVDMKKAVVMIQRRFRAKQARRKEAVAAASQKFTEMFSTTGISDRTSAQIRETMFAASASAKSAVSKSKRSAPTAIEVTVFEGRHFPILDWNTKACDPYVQIQVVSSDEGGSHLKGESESGDVYVVQDRPDGGSSKLFRTTTKIATREPSWGDLGEVFRIPTGKLGPAKNLHVLVNAFDYDRGSADDLIGKAEVAVDDVNAARSRSVMKWVQLMDVDGRPVLADASSGELKAELRVKIRALYNESDEGQRSQFQDSKAREAAIKQAASSLWSKIQAQKVVTTATDYGGEEIEATSSARPQVVVPRSGDFFQDYIVDRMEKLEAMITEVIASQNTLQNTLVTRDRPSKYQAEPAKASQPSS